MISKTLALRQFPILILLLVLPASALASTSVPAKHSYVVTSEQPNQEFIDKITLYAGRYCGKDTNYDSIAYFEFDPSELEALDLAGNPYPYLVLQVSQLADNLCQKKDEVNYLELYSTYLTPGKEVTWNTRPKPSSGRPIDSRMFLSNSVYYFKVPRHILEQMKSKKKPLLMIKASGDDADTISIKEIRKNARIEVLPAPKNLDEDGDGLDDVIEAQLGTDISSGDSDGDGVSDFSEVLLKLDPLKKVSSIDGTPDRQKAEELKEKACDYITCPKGISCFEGKCLVPELEDNELLQKYRELKNIDPQACLSNGGELCDPGMECDGTWAKEISEACCMGTCVVPESCQIQSVEWSTPEAYQGQPVSIVVEGAKCDGRIARVSIKEIDGIGDDDDISVPPLPAVIRGGKAQITWPAEWQDDGLMGGDPEYRVCVEIDGSQKCSTNELKVSRREPPTCAGGDGCNPECSSGYGDPDCSCDALIPDKAYDVCETFEECDEPIVGYEGVCCVDGCSSFKPVCGDGVCSAGESCLQDCSECTDEYDPVCGADGQTYSNACYAAESGVAVVSKGECDTVENDVSDLESDLGDLGSDIGDDLLLDDSDLDGVGDW